MVLSSKNLATIQIHDFTKELRDFEYETKFDIHGGTSKIFWVLKKIRGCFKNNQRFILCEIKGGDKLATRVSFFFGNNAEYSLFRYRGARMVKVKRHTVLHGTPFKIFKNDERLIIDKDDFFNKLKKMRHRFKRHNYRLTNLNEFLKIKSSLIDVGEMVKNRVKDFVFDAQDGRIYAVAITFCESRRRIQKQLEIEYAGYLPGFKNRGHNKEKQIIAGVQELSQYIYQHFSDMLQPSTERKFEFVKRHNAQI